MKTTQGKIRWFDKIDNEGVIVDNKGNEYYFNTSFTILSDYRYLKRKTPCTFTVKMFPNGTRCADNIILKQ